MSLSKPQPPRPEQPSSYLPAGPPEPQVFEEFEGINTTTSRPGVDDKQMWWCDGFMPIGKRFLRTMYGVGTRIYTATVSGISFFDFANIGATPYMIVVLNNGAIDAVNTSSLVVQHIAPASTITNPSRASVGVSQFGSQFIIIAAQQTQGYFAWDGVSFYKAGTVAPTIIISNNGSGYTSAPAVSDGTGGGATYAATVSGGRVTAITITNPGTVYGSNQALTLIFTGGGGTSAAATLIAMPTFISGSAIETYQGRVWLANNATIIFTAPGSAFDFTTANGGGNFTSTDSFLRVKFTQLKQTNGFLYLIGDSSVNYISGVQTSGTGPVTTTFTNQNADPEVGTPWGATPLVFSRNILFANPFGVQVSYGAAVTKISEALDGVYNTVPVGAFLPSASKAIIFGKKCFVLLLPIIDPINGQQVNKLLLWDGKGKWWATLQDVPLSYIQCQEINSVLTTYGTDGNVIYPLFNQPSVAFTKTVQSKLWDKPGSYHMVKASARLWAMFRYYSALAPDLRISIDNETASDLVNTSVGPLPAQWVTASGAEATWTTTSLAVAIWTSSGTGIVILAPTGIAQNGRLSGLTVETEAADMAIISMMIQNEVEGYAG